MVEFKKITADNLYELVNLSVKEEQKNFVASNSVSIMDAYVAITNDGIALPFGIYDGSKAVGFIMFTYGAKKDDNMPKIAYQNYCIWRFMIDQKYQKQGYGKKAIEKAIEYIKTSPCGRAEYCWLNYEPENVGAKAFYEKCGFMENGQKFYGEIIAVLRL